MSRGIPGERARLTRTIRDARASLGMTQEEFARSLEVAQSTVQNWESGRSRPKKALLRRILALPSSGSPVEGRKPRVSQETRGHLVAALDLILERAPSAIIQEVVEFLSNRAVKYGSPEHRPER